MRWKDIYRESGRRNGKGSACADHFDSDESLLSGCVLLYCGMTNCENENGESGQALCTLEKHIPFRKALAFLD